MARTAVVMACDARYAPYAAALADQIARAHPERGFDICLASAAPLELPDSLGGLGLRRVVMEGANPFAGGPHQSRHGAETFLRLLLPGRLAGEYGRLLYLDSDIWHEGGGLDRLMAADLGGAMLGAVRDNTQWRTPGRRNPEFRALGMGARPYFNAGVLLVDTGAWVAAGMEARLTELWRTKGAAMTRHDQSLLNVALDGGWAELSPVWNWQWTWSSRHFAEMVQPRLVHFIGRRKPWTDVEAELPPRFRAGYAGFAARHWPGRGDIADVDPDRPGWPANLRRGLVKHWFAAPAMQRYVGRFGDPFLAQKP
jgi:hypothetical protein